MFAFFNLWYHFLILVLRFQLFDLRVLRRRYSAFGQRFRTAALVGSFSERLLLGQLLVWKHRVFEPLPATELG